MTERAATAIPSLTKSAWLERHGPVPVVFVSGKAKANPMPEEVVAEYRDG